MQLLTSAMRAIGACLPTQVISIDPCMGAEPVMHAIFIIMVTTAVHAEEEEKGIGSTLASVCAWLPFIAWADLSIGIHIVTHVTIMSHS